MPTQFSFSICLRVFLLVLTRLLAIGVRPSLVTGFSFLSILPPIQADGTLYAVVLCRSFGWRADTRLTPQRHSSTSFPHCSSFWFPRESHSISFSSLCSLLSRVPRQPDPRNLTLFNHPKVCILSVCSCAESGLAK